jgi:hypothetical protein
MYNIFISKRYQPKPCTDCQQVLAAVSLQVLAAISLQVLAAVSLLWISSRARLCFVSVAPKRLNFVTHK